MAREIKLETGNIETTYSDSIPRIGAFAFLQGDFDKAGRAVQMVFVANQLPPAVAGRARWRWRSRGPFLNG